MLSVALVGCGGSAATYADGTYTGQSDVLDAGVEGDGYAVVTIEVSDGAISSVGLDAYLPDGTPKDDTYGKSEGATNYRVAQAAIAAGEEYCYILEQTGVLEDVDTISGATYLHDQFVEAAQEALSQASQ